MIDHRRVKRFTGVVLIGGLATLLPTTASAATVLFTNFGASLAYDTTQGGVVGNDFAGDNSAQGDSFMLSADSVFGSALVALSCVVGCPAAENFTVALTSDNSDSPGAVIESFVFTGVTLGGLGNSNAPVAVRSVLNPALIARTRYWITVSSSLAYSIAWNNTLTGDTNDQAVSSDAGATWFAPTGATPGALEVDGTVTPEASTGLLAGAGLIIAWYRKRSGGLRPIGKK